MTRGLFNKKRRFIAVKRAKGPNFIEKPPRTDFDARARSTARLAHRAASCCTATAHLGACLHVRVLQAFARRGTCIADTCAGLTDRTMQGRLAQHEVGRQMTDGDAIRHQLDVLRGGMFSPLLQTMCEQHRFALVMALVASVDAFLHFGVSVLHCSSLDGHSAMPAFW